MAPLDPLSAIVVFGATGDLAQRKLFPALLSLWESGEIPPDCHIVGFARRSISTGAFREMVNASLPAPRPGFTERISYISSLFEDEGGYRTLKEELERRALSGHLLFYVASSPREYEHIFSHLGECVLTPEVTHDARILVEKPFGLSEDHSQKLSSLVESMNLRERIYLVDHYLGKSALRALYALRQSGQLPQERIERVSARIWEKGYIGTRAGTYDELGALVDVGQNHLLQMLAALLSDPRAPSLHDARAEVISSLECEHVVQGQYEGYGRGDLGNSKTETYVRIEGKARGTIDIVLETGKALSESRAEIVVDFRTGRMIARIQPDPLISFEGIDQERFEVAEEDAYTQVIRAGIEGNRDLFVSFHEVEAAWAFISEVKELLRNTPLRIYPRGSRAQDVPNSLHA